MKILTITTPARIHIGFLDLDKNSIRKFGSLGLTISYFSYKIQIQGYHEMKIICKSKELESKIKKILNLLKEKTKLLNCKITVLNEIPIHNGLGSGTQLALSIGYLITKFNQKKININHTAQILNRGLRSGIGIESFKKGGFNIDVGKFKESIDPPLSILNLKWPKEWRILLIVDKNLKGIHGEKEVQEFKELKNMNFSSINCKSLLMKIVPGLIEKNFDEFSDGLRVIQDNMSRIFYGGINKFASSSIEKIFKDLKSMGIKSFGQSSWGPTGFIFFENSKKRNQLLNYLEKYISLNNISELQLIEVEGRNFGKKSRAKNQL